MKNYTNKEITVFLRAANSDLGAHKYTGAQMIPDYCKAVIIGQQLVAKNKWLREYIQMISKYAYAQHRDGGVDSHSELYQIATMCRDEQVEQTLKGIEP